MEMKGLFMIFGDFGTGLIKESTRLFWGNIQIFFFFYAQRMSDSFLEEKVYRFIESNQYRSR